MRNGITIISLVFLGLTTRATHAMDAPSAATALKQALLAELPEDVAGTVFQDIFAAAQSVDPNRKLAAILETNNLSPVVLEAAARLQRELPAQLFKASSVASLKEALVRELPTEQAASLFEQILAAAGTPGDVDSLLANHPDLTPGQRNALSLAAAPLAGASQAR